METKICKKCGRENYVDMKFCSECGAPFSQKEDKEELIFCPECGTKNKKGESFCEECGAKLEEDEEEAVTPSEKPSKEKKLEEDKEEYVFCPECGTKNRATEKFCEECGSNLSEDQAEEEPKEETSITSQEDIIEEEGSPEEPKIEEMTEDPVEEDPEEYIFCSECGTKNKATEKFCEECGSNLSEDQAEEEPKEETSITSQEDIIEEETSPEESKIEEITEEQIEEDPEEYIFCPECGTKNKATEKFCEECGSNLSEDQVEEEYREKVSIPAQKDIIEEEVLPEEPKIEEITEEQDEEEPKERTNAKLEEKVEKTEENSKEEVISKVSEEKKILSEKQEASIPTKNREKSQKKSTSKKKSPLIIVVLILLIAIVGGIGYKTGIIDNLLSKKSDPKKEIKKDDWSDWTEKLPKDITEKNYTIEEKTQYASKTKKTKTSDKKSMKGWTLSDTENAAGDQTETVKGIEEIKKFEEKDDIKITNRENIKEKYTAILCGYYTTPKDKNRFYSPKTAKPYCEEDDSYSLTEESEEKNSGTYKVGDNYQDKSYTNSDGNTIYYKVIKVTPTEVKFTYQSSEGTVYHFYKWSSWSKYSDKKIVEDENTKVKTRTVYRYKSKTK